jgi:signal transduction histidine kinase
LGTLAAGLAHELNNPAAAATRAVYSLRESCETLLSSLRHVADGEISARQFIDLDSLRREVKPRTTIPDPLALAEDEENLAEWLSRHGVKHEWDIAPTLAVAGVDQGWCERAAEALGDAALEPGLEWVASTLSLFSLLSEVEESTRRVSDIVASVKSYTQMDRAEIQRFDVTDGLESTIVMLGNKLRDVEVVRRYGSDLPEIEGHPGELNQVWTNLIDNAVDAMHRSGTLTLRTARDGEQLLVEIGDTGPGIPDDMHQQIFEPFFTTKPVGEGTGLGLDVSWRIVVNRHGGSMRVISEPGNTRFQVRLPLTEPRRR